MTEPVALDISLEKARALHRVWRALNDGDCPKCHIYQPATEMIREPKDYGYQGKGHDRIACPSCGFEVTCREIQEIEEMFAPAMDAAVAIFEEWRESRK